MCDLWESDAFIDDNTLTVNTIACAKKLAQLDVPEEFLQTQPFARVRDRVNEFRRTRFSPSAFIRGKALFLAGSTLFIVLLTLVLIVLEASTGGIILIDLIAVMGVAGYLILQYVRRASFWHQVEEATTNLEQGAHVVDLVDPPSFLEGRLAYEAMLATCKPITRDHRAEIERTRKC